MHLQGWQVAQILHPMASLSKLLPTHIRKEFTGLQQ